MNLEIIVDGKRRVIEPETLSRVWHKFGSEIGGTGSDWDWDTDMLKILIGEDATDVLVRYVNKLILPGAIRPVEEEDEPTRGLGARFQLLTGANARDFLHVLNNIHPSQLNW